MQLYLQARFKWSGSKLLRHFLQALAIYLAVWVSLSRISDYKHHWSDVLSGAILGTFLASLTVGHVSSVSVQSTELKHCHINRFQKYLMNWPICMLHLLMFVSKIIDFCTFCIL